MDSKEELAELTGSPSKESVGTSIEVQTGNSTEVLSLKGESVFLPQRVQQKSRSQVLKLKVRQIKIQDSAVKKYTSVIPNVYGGCQIITTNKYN